MLYVVNIVPLLSMFHICHSCLHCIILLEIQNNTPDSYRHTDGSRCVHLQGQAVSEESHAR